MPEMPHYAEAFAAMAGRCFRFISPTGEAGPTHCHEPPVWRGSFQAGDGKRYRVEACDGHRGGLESARRITPGS